MTTSASYYQSLGGILADDGIPLHFGDLQTEYEAALNAGIILDRSHEGRIILTGDNRFDFINRMSTNKIVDMPLHSSQATVFTNANARILYRVMSYNLPEGLLLVTEAGQGDAVASYLQRNIFYGDRVKVISITGQTNQFALHGLNVEGILGSLHPDLQDIGERDSIEVETQHATFTLIRRKSIVEQHWAIICQSNDAVKVFEQVLALSEPYGFKVAGSTTYNTLRTRAGRPARIELSSDYIPLEVGLWDEISFAKGCYTGQEIIARMESRQRIAKTLVSIDLTQFVHAPATLYNDGKSVGQLTSSVVAPDGAIFALAVVKTDFAKAETHLTVGDDRIPASVKSYAGKQPAFLLD